MPQVTLDTDFLASASELAELLGVSRSVISNYIARHDDFPQAVIDHPQARLWDLRDVVKWNHPRVAQQRQAAQRRVDVLAAELAEAQQALGALNS